MADQDYNRSVGGTNWWDSSARPSAASSSLPAASTSCSSVVFPQDQAASVMGLGLSSHPPLDHHWNSPLMSDKGGGEMGGGFRSMLQEGMAFGSSQTQKLFLGSADVESTPEFKPMKGFSLDQFSHTSSVDSCSQGLASPSFLNPLDSSSSSVYGSPTSSILQGLMGASDHHAPQQGGYGFNQGGYGMGPPGNSENLMGPGGGWSSNSSNKVVDHQAPQSFLKANNSMVDPNKPMQSQFGHGSFWNMAAAASMADVPRPAASFFPVASPLLQQPHQMNIPCFDEKPQHNVMEVRDTSGPGRKPSGSTSDQTTTSAGGTASTGGNTTKRSRNEASSALPPFKVRKEKMGDRITALQQLVSPFGKTDTASVLSEAIEYIKFLHEQVNVLSTPYLKSGASLQHQQGSDKSKDPEGPRQDLRSRGLCLVPVSSTFPVAHETTVDFWTPTFGGTFR